MFDNNISCITCSMNKFCHWLVKKCIFQNENSAENETYDADEAALVTGALLLNTLLNTDPWWPLAVINFPGQR